MWTSGSCPGCVLLRERGPHGDFDRLRNSDLSKPLSGMWSLRARYIKHCVNCSTASCSRGSKLYGVRLHLPPASPPVSLVTVTTHDSPGFGARVVCSGFGKRCSGVELLALRILIHCSVTFEIAAARKARFPRDQSDQGCDIEDTTLVPHPYVLQKLHHT